MRLHGTTIADLSGDGEFQYTTLLAGITEIGLNTPGLRLAIHLFEVMSYPDPADKNKVTAQYKSEFEFIQKRVRWPWTRAQLTKGKNSMINVGLLREIDGDWHLDISVIPRNQLTSKRRKSEEEVSKAPRVADAPAAKKAAPKALAESTAPVVTVTQEVVQADVAPEREKVLANLAHQTSEAKLRGQRHRAKELQKEIERDEHRGGDSSYAAWEAKRQAEAEEFKRSLQEPEPSIEEEAPSPAPPIDSEPVHIPAKPEPPNVETIQPSARELEFAKRRKEAAEDEARMQLFAEWLDYKGDPREMWDNKDAWGYQEYLEYLKPKPQPKPEPVPVGVSSDDAEQW